MSNKDTNKYLVGQPILKQILNFIPKDKFLKLVYQHKSDRYYKTFDSWTQLITMLFGILSRCDSMNEICDGMRALSGKLNHLGMDRSPAKSTAGDGLRGRDQAFFKDLYFILLEHFKPLLSVSRNVKTSFNQLFIFDSTTISLFSEVMKGVGRNHKNEGKKKGGLKVHMMIDAHSDTPHFVKISDARQHDKQFLTDLKLSPHSMIVFDRAYNQYSQFAKWSEQGVYFVGRLKKNAVYEVEKVLFPQELTDEKQSGVFLEEHINLNYQENEQKQTLCLRKVSYKDEKGRIYHFISNNLDIGREEVASIYKLRWNIELLFKKLKQNFQLHYFYSETENGIKTQIWCTLIALLLLQVLRVHSESKKAFSTIATLVRIHLISLIDVVWMVQNCVRTYTKRKIRNKSPCFQTDLFD